MSSERTGVHPQDKNEEVVIRQPRLFYELESIFIAVRKTEIALKKEKTVSSALEEELAKAKIRHRTELEEAARRVDVAEKANIRLEERLQALVATLAQARTELSAQTAEREKQQQQLNRLELELGTARADIDHMRTHAKRIETELARQLVDRQESTQREFEARSRISELEGVLERQSMNARTIQARNIQLEQESIRLARELELTREQAGSARQALHQKANAEIGQLIAALQNAERSKSQLQRLKTELECRLIETQRQATREIDEYRQRLQKAVSPMPPPPPIGRTVAAGPA